MMADQGGAGIVTREYRKGNWTVNETMVLIEAKKMDDERRMKKSEGKPTELRWKWVENYCWSRGCLRSQNQCNDKWDNLMRDYKKVRDYQRRGNDSNYWEMAKNRRKGKNLPTNMLRQIYELLEEVVEKKGGQRVVLAAGATGRSVPLLLKAPPLPPIAAPIPLLQPPLLYAQSFPTVDVRDTSDSDTSEHSDSVAKRRRISGVRGDGEGTSGCGGAASPSNSNEVRTAICKSASIIAEAIRSCEENEGRRHRDLISFHERRLQIEESKQEINRRGIDGLVDTINKLSNSVIALASHKNRSAPK